MGVIAAALVGGAIACKFNKKIEETLALAMIVLTSIIYAIGLNFSLLIGVYVDIALVVVSIVYLLVALVKDKTKARQVFITWGALAFILYFFVIALYSYNRGYDHPDDFYCWGLMIKGFYEFKDMFSDLSSAITAGQPPFMCLWDYFNAELSGGYSEFICFVSHNMFVMSLVLPFFAHISEKLNAKRFVVMIAILPCLFVLSGLEGFRTILMDGALAAFVIFIILNVIKYTQTSEKYYYIASLFAVAAICLVKRMGVVFAGLSILIATITLFEKKRKSYIEIIGYVIAATISTLSWVRFNYYIVIPLVCTVIAVFIIAMIEMATKMSPKMRDIYIASIAFGGAIVMYIGTMFKFRGNGYAFIVLARFMESFCSISIEDGYIKLSYGLYLLIGIIMVPILHRKAKGSSLKYVGISVVFSMIIYALIMLVIHISTIGPGNFYKESLIERYMIPWEIVVGFIVIYSLMKYYDKLNLTTMVIALIVVLLISDSGTMLWGFYFKRHTEDYSAVTNSNVTLNSDDMIYYIDEEYAYGYANREFYYCAFPAKTNFIYNVIGGEDLGRIEMTCEEFSDKLYETYDYVYIQSYSEDFIDRYGQLFNNSEEIKEKCLYTVEKNSGDARLCRLDLVN
ncbi:hypothetical protein [Butyrivibrio hungatei]|uniref:Glycosyltransferase RgtA/B/C/D-like domain-containing protein n=1 Tax=Butyrivibrio hungatei TaxID=185008 RepID=A0A1D9NYY0_9FIRM|nr:hypothetical protein [Butyrivibrio hungatei]AOZ95472.1 hypothetical protein bhn_I0438 [Butyrivibrio hungatei]